MAGYSTTTASSSSVFAPGLSSLADPPTRYVDAAAMDYLLIEAVQALRTSSAVAAARMRKLEKDMMDAGILPPTPPAPSVPKKETQRDSVGSMSSKTGQSTKASVDPEDEDVQSRLEAIGVHMGSNITERCLPILMNHQVAC